MFYIIQYICFFYIFQKEPKSCTFQVNKTKSCPSNQTEWNKRSKDMNCSKTNGYMCIPNESFTELLEFCYDHPRILILEGKRDSRKYGPPPPPILHTHTHKHTHNHRPTHPHSLGKQSLL